MQTFGTQATFVNINVIYDKSIITFTNLLQFPINLLSFLRELSESVLSVKFENITTVSGLMLLIYSFDIQKMVNYIIRSTVTEIVYATVYYHLPGFSVC